jgi:UDP-N-acetylglucosamine/UDP-N-acetylgalactosamine diphosphorylase
MEIQELTAKLEAAGQQHLLQFAAGLSEDKRLDLFNSIKSCDFALLAELYRTLHQSEKPSLNPAEIQPFPEVTVLETAENITALKEIGINLIAQGKVAALVLAAGTGTRLGFNLPKGMYDIQLTSHKTLFQIQAERVLCLERLVAEITTKEVPPIPLLVMTNEETHDTIGEFFEQNDSFGLYSGQIRLFQQSVLPSLDFEGKVILDTPSKLSVSPNGNGGVYSALESTGTLAWLEERGTEYVHLFSVDNALIKICDPVFIGFTSLHNFDISTKTVPKASPDEAIGVVVLNKRRPGIAEYSEIPSDLARATNQDGSLVYNTGSICNHVFSVRFLRSIITSHLGQFNQHYHKAVKKIAFVDQSGVRVTPEQPNGLKFELFYFDVMQFAERTGILQVKRNEEFAPVKNAPGSSLDSPDTARSLLKALHMSWLTKAGARFQDEASAEDTRVEISPLVSYEGEGLETFAGQSLSFPVYIYY